MAIGAAQFVETMLVSARIVVSRRETIRVSDDADGAVGNCAAQARALASKTREFKAKKRPLKAADMKRTGLIAQDTPSNSTSNTSVALGGITPPAPRAP